jgi:hypothetical protein
MAAANSDPIIVANLSPYRCYAFLIERGWMRFLELSDIAPLLEWLWDAICRPSLDALGLKDPISDDNWPRVWWVPTRLFNQLPLRAAGRYTQGRPTKKALDKTVLSYASSIKVLTHGHQPR